MSPILKRILGKRIADYLDCRRFFAYDRTRFLRHSGAYAPANMEARRAVIIRTYHIVEKGLTMPNRHWAFGIAAVRTLMTLVDEFEALHGRADKQVGHAVAVIQSYRTLHEGCAVEAFAQESTFWREVGEFCDRHSEESPSHQPHVAFESFYAMREAAFPEFARARHVVRHYSSAPVDLGDIRNAVKIACTAPTACNR